MCVSLWVWMPKELIPYKIGQANTNLPKFKVITTRVAGSNVFSRVYLSVQEESGYPHRDSPRLSPQLYRDLPALTPSSYRDPRTHSNLLNLDLTVQSPSPRHVQTCSLYRLSLVADIRLKYFLVNLAFGVHEAFEEQKTALTCCW